MSLSTHVLDTATGRPAAGVVVLLQRPAVDAARRAAVEHRSGRRETGQAGEAGGAGETGGAGEAEAYFVATLGTSEWVTTAEAVTDEDGRIARLPATTPGLWRLVFDTRSRSSFFPEVALTFAVDDPTTHLHVPLLLAPYGFSTYRGS